MSRKDDEGCEYCNQNPDVLNDADKGYAVLWDKVKKQIDRLVAQGMSRDLAVTKALNNWIVWVTGSTICKIRTEQWVIRKFWAIYRDAKGDDVGERVQWTTNELLKLFERKHPEAWKCLTGQDYERKVAGAQR
jgi:hypothetical protein